MSAFVDVLLVFCVLATLLAPLYSKRFADRLVELVLVMGVVTATLGWVWSETLLLEALLRPAGVCGALLLGALILSYTHEALSGLLRQVLERIGARAAVGGAVLFAGCASAFVTSAIGILILVELLTALRLERKSEMHAAVLGSFAVALGGGISPFASPVAAIAMAKLNGPPYFADNWFLFWLLGAWVLPAIVSLAVLAGTLFAEVSPGKERPLEEDPYGLMKVLKLTGRMYLFIAGLVLLGAGLIPVVDKMLVNAPAALLYWVNTVSALVDGATLATVEITPKMSLYQLRYILMGVLLAAGMLVPGNAPNLVAAHKLEIPYRDWARIGAPVGLVLMLFYFVSLGISIG